MRETAQRRGERGERRCVAVTHTQLVASALRLGGGAGGKLDQAVVLGVHRAGEEASGGALGESERRHTQTRKSLVHHAHRGLELAPRPRLARQLARRDGRGGGAGGRLSSRRARHVHVRAGPLAQLERAQPADRVVNKVELTRGERGFGELGGVEMNRGVRLLRVLRLHAPECLRIGRHRCEEVLQRGPIEGRLRPHVTFQMLEPVQMQRMHRLEAVERGSGCAARGSATRGG